MCSMHHAGIEQKFCYIIKYLLLYVERYSGVASSSTRKSHGSLQMCVACAVKISGPTTGTSLRSRGISVVA